MENSITVQIYGVPAGRRREQRLGTGTLGLPRLVMPDDDLERLLGRPRPPSVRRVGIGFAEADHVGVEVIEVRQVMRSDQASGVRTWGLELAEDSRAPIPLPTDSASSDGPTPAPAVLWCLLFPQASFCH